MILFTTASSILNKKSIFKRILNIIPDATVNTLISAIVQFSCSTQYNIQGNNQNSKL